MWFAATLGDARSRVPGGGVYRIGREVFDAPELVETLVVSRQVVVRLVGLASGGVTAVDGQWLVEYDPSRRGEIGGRVTLAHVVCSPDVGRARRFSGAVQAFDYVRQVSGFHEREDGQVSRPLMAYTLAVYPVGADGSVDVGVGLS